MVGNLMTASYCSGLTLGSLLAYWLDSLLGPNNSNPCPEQLPTLSPPTHRFIQIFHPVLSAGSIIAKFFLYLMQVLRKPWVLLVRVGS